MVDANQLDAKVHERLQQRFLPRGVSRHQPESFGGLLGGWIQPHSDTVSDVEVDDDLVDEFPPQRRAHHHRGRERPPRAQRRGVHVPPSPRVLERGLAEPTYHRGREPIVAHLPAAAANGARKVRPRVQDREARRRRAQGPQQKFLHTVHGG